MANVRNTGLGKGLKSAKDKASEALKQTKTPKSTTQTKVPKNSPDGSSSTGLAVGSFQNLTQINETMIDSHMGKFEINQFQNPDPLRPNANAPRQTDSDRQQAATIYREQGNALESFRDHAVVAGKSFGVVKERANAFKTGLEAATAIEGVKQAAYQYQSAQNRTVIAGLELGTVQHERQTVEKRVVYDRAKLDHKLTLANYQAQEQQGKAEELKRKLETMGINPTRSTPTK